MGKLFQGSWQKVLIRVIVLLLVLYVFYRIGKVLLGLVYKNKTSKEFKKYIEELKNVTPIDNSTLADPDTISENEAKLIAAQLENAMDGIGTNESSMFNSLQCLNGASLKKVYTEFGQRNYSGWGYSTMMDLFGWFSEELGNVVWATYSNECVLGCEGGILDNCMELTYMREIWKRTGMTLTF